MSTQTEFTKEQLEVLKEVNSHLPGDLYVLRKSELHAYMVSGQAYTDGEYLIFLDDEVSPEEQNRFLYYMGAETEARIIARFRGVTVYEGISPSRLMSPGFAEEDEDPESRDVD